MESIRNLVSVFLAYAREDTYFARKVVGALEKERVTVLWDDNLIPGPDYELQIRNYILRCHAVIFVISADSAVSPACREEVEYAASQKKRIIPLAFRDHGDDRLLHNAIRSPQWIYFRDGELFDNGITKLVVTIQTDFDLVPEHSRLLESSNYWLQNSRNRSYLLSGDGLSAAEDWLTRIGAQPDRLPQPTKLIAEYIRESQQGRRNRARFRAVLIALIMVILGTLTIYAFLEGNRAKQSAEEANKQKAEAQSNALEAERQRNLTEEHRQVLLSQNLAIQSRNQPADRFDTSLLMALAALNIKPTPDAQHSFLDSYLKLPHLIKMLHHDDLRESSNPLLFIPDQTVVSGGCGNYLQYGECVEGLIQMWNLKTGRTILRLMGHTKEVKYLGLTHDHRTIVSVSDSGDRESSDTVEIIFWEIENPHTARHVQLRIPRPRNLISGYPVDQLVDCNV